MYKTSPQHRALSTNWLITSVHATKRSNTCHCLKSQSHLKRYMQLRTYMYMHLLCALYKTNVQKAHNIEVYTSLYISMVVDTNLTVR